MKLLIYHTRADEYARAVAARCPDLDIIAGPDEAALARGLDAAEVFMASKVPIDGALAGAALDVFAEEPLAAASPFCGLPNVIVTPHIAGEPSGYAERVVSQVFVDNLARYRAGRPLRNVVDLARGY